MNVLKYMYVNLHLNVCESNDWEIGTLDCDVLRDNSPICGILKFHDFPILSLAPSPYMTVLTIQTGGITGYVKVSP